MRIITKLNHSDPLTVPVASVLGWGLRVYYVEQVGSAFIIEIAGSAISLSSMRKLHAEHSHNIETILDTLSLYHKDNCYEHKHH